MSRALLSFLFLLPSLLPGQESVRGSYRLQVGRGATSNRLILSDSSGATLYSIERSRPFDTPSPQPHLFSNGTVLLLDAFAGVYEFYSNNGRMADRIPLGEKVRPNHERIVSIGGNDSLAAILVSEPEQTTSRILVVGQDGTTKLDRLLEGAFGLRIELSPGGRRLAAGTYSWEGSSVSFRTMFLTMEGNILSSIRHEFKGGAWGPRDSVFLVYGREDAAIVNVGTGLILSDVRLATHRVVLTSVWDGVTPIVVAAEPPHLAAGRWVYSGFVVLDPFHPSSVKRIDRTFRTLEMRRVNDTLSVQVDGQIIPLK